MTIKIAVLVVLAFAILFPPGGAASAAEVVPFVYVPSGTEISGSQTVSFQPYARFNEDYRLWGANLVFSPAGYGFYFPVALVDFDGGDEGVLLGAGYNQFFDSQSPNGRWLGDIRYTHVTEADTDSITGTATHVWYTGNAITYAGGHLSGVFGDSDGLGWGGHIGVKFGLSENAVLELQGGYDEFDDNGALSAGFSLGFGV
ncbi:MAG: hypothetical protein HRF49_01890 [bacterium]|jgi:hypothetical protein